MPGFSIPQLGDRHITNFGNTAAITTEKFIYNYSWDISQLFEVAQNVQPTIYLKDASLPSITIEKETAKGAVLEYKYASKVGFDDIRLTFYDTYKLLPILQEWLNMVYSYEGGIRPASYYKKYSEIIVYDPNGVPTQSYGLHGSWLSGLKFGDLTYTGSDVKIVEATLTYDFIVTNSLLKEQN